ncbi:MAG: hypothetical protein JWL62_2226 [Hyphomicrobiales bacterium]|nr:hypothetical protein [Hyphomicrobiales bacterium]
MDRLKAIDAFVLTARSGSFAGAARHLRVSRAMVSRHVADLEAHLGVRLFNRTTRELSLTAAGERYLRVCSNVLQQLEQEEASIASIQKEMRGVLRIVAVRSFGERHVAAAVAEFSKQHPSLRIELELAPGTRAPLHLHDNGFDVGVSIASGRTQDTVTRRIASFNWVLCASPAYLSGAGKLETPVDLVQHRTLVNLRHCPNGIWTFHNNSKKAEVAVTSAISATNFWAIREAVLLDAGVAILPSFCIKHDVESGAIVRVLPRWSMKDGQIDAVYPHYEHVPNKVRAFTNHLRQKFSGALEIEQSPREKKSAFSAEFQSQNATQPHGDVAVLDGTH